MRALRQQAKQDRISLNTLATQILSQHIDWQRTAGISGFIPLSRTLFISLLAPLSDEKISQLAETELRAAHELLLMQSPDSFISFLECWLRAAGIPYKIAYNTNDDTASTLFINHGMGAKVSLYLSKYLGLSPFFEIQVETTPLALLATLKSR